VKSAATYCERCGLDKMWLRSDGVCDECAYEAEVTGNGKVSTASSASTAIDTAPHLAPDSAAFNGVAGEVVRAIEPHTEADPAGLLANVLARFGAMVGPMAEARVGFVHHPPVIWPAIVGRSSRSRKDTAQAEVRGVLNHVEDGWNERHELGGFGSGEALIEQASQHPNEAILMVESEFGRVLAAASRDGSTVSQVLRQAFDFRRMEHRIRGKAFTAPPTPVSLIGHITADELKDRQSGLRPVEIMNGFGNRVLWVYVDRRRIDAHLKPMPTDTLNALVRRLRASLDGARQARNPVERSGAAEELWDDLYGRVANDDGMGLVGTLTARAEAQLLRLSLIYALLDGTDVIQRSHLEAAWEFWRYCRWSAQHIWVGPGTGDPDLDRIADILDGGDRLDARALDRMFYGHRSGAEVRRKAITAGIAVEEREKTGGRDRIVLVAGKAEQAGKGPLWWTSTAFSSSSAGVTKEER
jgi:Protein of unknown function (DUF3987)